MVTLDALRDVCSENKAEIEKASIIRRDAFTEAEKTLSQEEVTVICGVRRSGKTFLLFDLFRAHPGIYVNFEDERLEGFSTQDFEKLLVVLEENGGGGLYLDEVQHAKGWEKFAHRAHRKVKIVASGSNSSLLSSEYSSALVGRTKTLFMHTLSFPEFLRFRKEEASQSSLASYLRMGGFPRIVESGDVSLAKEYFKRIIYRDIIPRYSIRMPEALYRLAVYFASNLGKPFTYRSLKEFSGLGHETTVREYISCLKDAFLLDVVSKYSPSLKKRESFEKKAYLVDVGFSSLGQRVGEDSGRLLENVVYNHLKMRGGNIFFLKNGYEVDFAVCPGLSPSWAVNVAYEIPDEKTLSREVSGLLKADYPSLKKRTLVCAFSPPEAKIPPSIEVSLAHRFLEKYAS